MQTIIERFTTNETEETSPKLGQIMTYAGEDIPAGFLPCDGRMLRRQNHPKLFKILRTKYGDGDGSNTAFNLPRMSDEEQGVHYIIYVDTSE